MNGGYQSHGQQNQYTPPSQNFGVPQQQHNPGPPSHGYNMGPNQQGQIQEQRPLAFGQGSDRAQQNYNQTVLQPVPVPRQASMGLLAMINGTVETGR